MKKLSSILLIICLCSTWLGYHLLFDFQLSAIKSDMQASLKNQACDKDVTVFSFSEMELEQLEWEEETEFRYDGEMYDLVEKKIEGSRVVVRCIEDSKETSLLANYEKNTKRHSSNGFIAQFTSVPFILPSDNLPKQRVQIVTTTFPRLSSALATSISTVVSPPPDVS